jgi:hypothetical protein
MSKVYRKICTVDRWPIFHSRPCETFGHPFTADDTTEHLLSVILDYVFIRRINELLRHLLSILNIVHRIKSHDLVCQRLDLTNEGALPLLYAPLGVVGSDGVDVDQLDEENQDVLELLAH